MGEWIPPETIRKAVAEWQKKATPDALKKAQVLAYQIYMQRGGTSTQKQQDTDMNTALEIIMEDENQKPKA